MARGRARGPGKRVLLNREAADAIALGAADGLQGVGMDILVRARPHVWDRPPIGQGLVQTGEAVTYVDGRKVAGTGTAPRGEVVRQGITTIVGYGFPGRFQEIGTVHQRARPVLTPAIGAEIPSAPRSTALAITKRLKRVRRNAT